MRLQVNLSKYLPFNELKNEPPSLKGMVTTQLLLAHQIREALEVFLKNTPIEETPLKKDVWGFSYYWHLIKGRCPTVEALYREISERKSSIEKVKEIFRKTIADLALLPYTNGMSPDGTYKLDPSRVRQVEDGISGTYFLYDEKGQPRFVIKPMDEEPGCINNPKGFATPFADKNPIRNYMPLYESALRETAAYRLAALLGLSSIVPKTDLAIFDCSKFSDLSDRVDPSEIERFLENAGAAIREKLCSVQEFVPNSKTLFEGLQEFQMAGLSDEEIAERFDLQDFEETNILIWSTYDTDAHGANILVYPKGVDAIGNEILGMKKIDNGLAFPTENKQLRNHLQYHPLANRTLSDRSRQKIAAMDPDKMAQTMNETGLESAIPAMRERIQLLKELALQPDLTIRQINTRMALMERLS